MTMADAAKLKRLQDLRYKLSVGKFKADELATLTIEDVDGSTMRMSDDQALAVLDRRIAAEQAAGGT